MTRKAFTRVFIKHLACRMRVFDFKPVFELDGFERKLEDCTFYYWFDVQHISSGDTFLVQPHVTICNHEIENIFCKVSGCNEVPLQYSTVGNSLALINSNPRNDEDFLPTSFIVNTAQLQDVEHIAGKCMQLFADIALPYCLSYQTVEQIDGLLNDHFNIACIHQPHAFYRAVKGLIAACITNNHSLQQLSSSYKKRIRSYSELDGNEILVRLAGLLPRFQMFISEP